MGKLFTPAGREEIEEQIRGLKIYRKSLSVPTRRAIRLRSETTNKIKLLSNLLESDIGESKKTGKWLTPAGRAQIKSNIEDLQDALTNPEKPLTKLAVTKIETQIQLFENFLEQDLEERK